MRIDPGARSPEMQPLAEAEGAAVASSGGAANRTGGGGGPRKIGDLDAPVMARSPAQTSTRRPRDQGSESLLSRASQARDAAKDLRSQAEGMTGPEATQLVERADRFDASADRMEAGAARSSGAPQAATVVPRAETGAAKGGAGTPQTEAGASRAETGASKGGSGTPLAGSGAPQAEGAQTERADATQIDEDDGASVQSETLKAPPPLDAPIKETRVHFKDGTVYTFVAYQNDESGGYERLISVSVSNEEGDTAWTPVSDISFSNVTDADVRWEQAAGPTPGLVVDTLTEAIGPDVMLTLTPDGKKTKIDVEDQDDVLHYSADDAEFSSIFPVPAYVNDEADDVSVVSVVAGDLKPNSDSFIVAGVELGSVDTQLFEISFSDGTSGTVEVPQAPLISGESSVEIATLFAETLAKAPAPIKNVWLGSLTTIFDNEAIPGNDSAAQFDFVSGQFGISASALLDLEDELQFFLVHEAAHALDTESGQIGVMSDTVGWKDAVEEDGIYVSQYAATTPVEDFAESYAVWYSVRTDQVSPEYSAQLESEQESRFAFFDGNADIVATLPASARPAASLDMAA